MLKRSGRMDQSGFRFFPNISDSQNTTKSGHIPLIIRNNRIGTILYLTPDPNLIHLYVH